MTEAAELKPFCLYAVLSLPAPVAGKTQGDNAGEEGKWNVMK